MAISKCEKWIYENHRTILWLLFILSMYFVCILKLKNNIETGGSQDLLAFFGKKDTQDQLVESNSQQHGSLHRIYEAPPLIPIFRRREHPGPVIKSDQVVGKPDYKRHGSTSIFSHGRRSGHGFDSNAFEKFIRFLTPSSVRCRSPAPSIVKNLLFDATVSWNIRDQNCFDQLRCEMLTNVADKNRCPNVHSPVNTAQLLSRKISSRHPASSVLSRFVPKGVWNILRDELGHSAKPSVKNIDLHIDESLSFLSGIKELRAAREREMELNLHLNFSGLNTLRKHGIVEQFLRSAAHTLHPRVLVRSSLPPAMLHSLLHTEAVGDSAAVILKTTWDRRGTNTENESSRTDYFNNLH